jgi:anti-sigma factor RsiW
MNCHRVQSELSAFLDGRIAADAKESVANHLSECRDCERNWNELYGLRSAVRGLATAAPPARLETQLRVLASRERARLLATRTWPAAIRYWSARAELAASNLMRPLALPLAGGLCSALVLFSMLVPTLGVRPDPRNDVPLTLYTEAKLSQAAPFSLEQDIVVEVTVNERGQISDYSVPGGKISREMETDLANLMLFTSFTPATWFGQPTSGKLRLSFRRSRIFIRG